MTRLDERGKLCPMPVIDTKKALERCGEGEVVEVLVDNEIAVQNLKKMAGHKGLLSSFDKLGSREFVVRITAGGAASGSASLDGAGSAPGMESGASGTGEGDEVLSGSSASPEGVSCQPDSRRKGMVVVLSSNLMGQGDDALGKVLMKGFVYALSQQDILPETVLLYNSGAFLSSEGSDNLEDLKELEAQGVEILTCGACMKHYGLEDKLKAGSVTNMYEIAERMSAATLLVRP